MRPILPLPRKVHKISRPIIYFIRHGETDWNVEGRLQGQRDISLNANGRRQAADAGRILSSLSKDAAGLDFLSSPLGRTRETMEILRETIGLPPQEYATDDRLKELAFGVWEGLIWSEAEARDPLGAAARRRDKWGYAPPGGESYAMLAERVMAAVDRLTDDTVLVSHGGVGRALLAKLSGVSIWDAPRMEMYQGRVLVFKDRKHIWY